MNDYDPYDPSLLPPVVVRYLDDHSDPEATAQLFAQNARVVDEGVEYVGLDAIRGWLGRAASQYTYTATPMGQRSEGQNRWVVLVRLEGNFPGGIVDLRYQAATEGDLIVDLVIEV